MNWIEEIKEAVAFLATFVVCIWVFIFMIIFALWTLGVVYKCCF
jgi:hypothetical protein